MRILLVKKDETVIESTDLEEMQTMLDDNENLIWIDLYRDSDEECRRILTLDSTRKCNKVGSRKVS